MRTSRRPKAATNGGRLARLLRCSKRLSPPLLGYGHVSTGTYLTRKATLENPAVAPVTVGSRARHPVRDTPGAADYDHVQESLGSVPIPRLSRPPRCCGNEPRLFALWELSAAGCGVSGAVT